MITTDHVGPILHPVESRTPPTFDADVDYELAPLSEAYYAAAAHRLNGEMRAAREAREARAARAADPSTTATVTELAQPAPAERIA